MKKTTFTLLLSLSCGWLVAQCPTGDVTFSTQGQIDSFPINYPNCSEMDSSITISGGGIVRLDSLYSLKKIGGRLEISGTSLTNLQGLSQLDSVISCLIIADNSALKGLNGLKNLRFVGKCAQTNTDVVTTWGLSIGSNKQLTSLAGLEKLRTLGGCISIAFNDELTSLAGLENLSSIGECYFRSGSSVRFDGMAIYGNFQLTTLDGLGKLDSLAALRIEENPFLTSLDALTGVRTIQKDVSISYNPSLSALKGLDSLASIGWRLSIYGNDALTTLNGLEKLDTLGRCLSVSDNPKLESLDALSRLKSIGTCYVSTPGSARSLTIYNNTLLHSIQGLGKTQFGGPGTLSITKCPSLSMCEIESICKNLSSVVASNNAPGCNSVAEIEAACLVPTGELGPTGPPLQISPNPATDFLQIQISDNEKWDISLFDLQGRLLYRQVVSGNQSIDVADWPTGLYALRAVSGGRVYAGRFVKQ